MVTKVGLRRGVRISPHGIRAGRALKGLLTYVRVEELPEDAADDRAEILQT